MPQKVIDLERALWLDVEASGFGPDSYPIEVGWSDIEGRTGSVLIRPAPHWTYWDAAARIAEVTAERVLLSDNPNVDSWWLARLFLDASWPNAPCHLHDTDAVLMSFVGGGLEGPGEYIVAEQHAKQLAPITHRAADDARFWATFTRILARGA